MKIKRFTAPDMRAAIRRVREEQGADAVILSSTRVAGGVEIIAATDYDEALMQQASRQPQEPAPSQPMARPEPEPETYTDSRFASQIQQDLPEPPRPSTPEQPRTDTMIWQQDPAIAGLHKELEELRSSMENQLRSLTYDLQAPSADHAEAIRNLTTLGVDATLARAIVAALPEETESGHLRYQALMGLAQQLTVSETDPILEGGHFALIGPTGVGKTTTIAKLAARFTARHGLQDVALVTTDAHRVGAREQLLTYGQLLGLPVFTAHTRAELDDVLSKLAERTLVLIDTAGMSPRDCRLASQFDVLAAAGGRLRTYLVLAANAHAADLERAVARFRATRLSGCVLTKLDESSRIGGALSMAIGHRLPIAYVADGQQVPEDLHRERPDQLILRALRAARGPESGPSSHTVEENMHACA